MHQKFKVKTCLVLIILAIILLTACAPEPALSRNMTVSRYEIQVSLQDDGSAEITEMITCYLTRGRAYFDFNIDYAAAGSVKLKNISVATQSGTGSQSDYIEVQPADAASNQVRATTYEVKDDGSSLQIRLHAKSESGTSRVVKLTYRLAQVVWRQQDTSLLKWRFFTTPEVAPIDQLKLAIRMPEVFPELETWNLPISLAEFSVSQTSGDQLDFQAGHLPAGEALILYCLYPADSFSEASAAPVPQTWESLTSEARSLDVELHNQASTKYGLYNLIFMLLGFSVIVVLLIYWFFDRESAVKIRQRNWQAVPAEYPPAVVVMLMRKSKPGKIILSTLLDLTRRGELSLHGCVFTLNKPERKDYSGFTAYEIFLIHWLFGRITTETTLSTAEIRRFARDPATAEEFQTYYLQFRQLIDEELASRELIDIPRTRRGRTLALLAGLAYLVMAAAGVLYLRDSAGLLLLVPSACMVIYSWQIQRLTAAGRELYATGQALYRLMKNCTRPELKPDREFFCDALPLAVGLGVGSRLLDQLLITAKDQQTVSAADPLAPFGVGKSAKAWPEQIRSLAADLKVMESMLSASLLMASGIHW